MKKVLLLALLCAGWSMANATVIVLKVSTNATSAKTFYYTPAGHEGIVHVSLNPGVSKEVDANLDYVVSFAEGTRHPAIAEGYFGDSPKLKVF